VTRYAHGREPFTSGSKTQLGAPQSRKRRETEMDHEQTQEQSHDGLEDGNA
jgi:hypothetical protein